MRGFSKIFAFGAVLLLLAKTAIGQIPVPLINTNYIIVVTNAPYSAAGDSVTTNTTAIQNAINAASLGGVTNGLRGGVVEIPYASGTYLCGPLNLSSYVDLQIDSGATLQMLPLGSYPGGSSPADFITASKIQDIEISGFGKIDGQGQPWWTYYDTNNSLVRPYTMFGPSGCSTVLVCNVTFQNPPNTHMAFGASGSVGACQDVLITNITINTPDGTPNTDGIDLDAANAEIVNSYISDGDDHIAIGGTSGYMTNIVVTNCFFGTGHGVSIGSYTDGGVSNLLVINCAWSGSENGLRLKSERGRGGLVQDLTYENLGMTNVQWPILFYSYYNYGEGQLEDATPYMAATDSAQTVTSTTPIWRNVIVSNVTATAASSYPAIMIWGLPEMLISNVTLDDVAITGASGTKTCQFYYVNNLQLINSRVTFPNSTTTYTFYGAQMIVSNNQSSATVTLNGLSTNGVGNAPAFYGAPASLQNTNTIAGGPLTLGNGAFTVNNSFSMPTLPVFNFQIGTNAATVAVKNNLVLGGTVNVTAGSGFTNGTYTLLTYGGSLSGNTPALGATPAGYNYAFNTATAGQVNLIVIPLAPSAPANLIAQATNLAVLLQWPPPSGATGYNLMRSTTNGGPYSLLATPAVTNYSDSAVVPGTTYYYVVSATNSSGQSPDSSQASAAPLPSLLATNLNFQITGNQLQLSWPQDHQGWELQIQTNDLSAGIGTNWITVPNSTNVITTNILISPGSACVFFRLIYP